jgi:hypothetical protein
MKGFNIRARQPLTAALTLIGLLGALFFPHDASLQGVLIHPPALAQAENARVRRSVEIVAPATTVNAPSPSSGRNAAGGAVPARLLQAYGQMPLSFTANGGQADSRFDFISRGSGYQLFLSSTEAVLLLQQGGALPVGDRARAVSTPRREQPSSRRPVKMQLLGARSEACPAGREELAGKVNYLTGTDPRNWKRGLAAYRRVEYEGVYPGINLVYYGNQQQLEYDFVLSPGADPGVIRLGFDGVDKLTVNDAGELVLRVGKSVIKQSKPLIYQETAGGRREVAGRYALTSRNQVGFAVGAYDAGKPLVIDPVLIYNTHFGSIFGGEESYGIAVDADGSAYVAGAAGDGFPTTGSAYKRTSAGGDVFVIKLTPDGSGFVYSTFLGGSDFEIAQKIAVDSTGSAYVAGWTLSKDFPLRNAFDVTLNEGIDGFMVRLDATGSDLLYSTYLGGSNQDIAHGIALGAPGSAYVTGRTFSADFPVSPGAFRSTLTDNGFRGDGFVTKINTQAPGQSSLIYSTYMGSASTAIAADPAGNAYVTGGILVRKLNATGTALIYDFEVPGLRSNSPMDTGLTRDIDIDPAGNAYVTGDVAGNVLAVRNGFQTVFKGASDAFLIKLDASGNELLYSTYLGGIGFDYGGSLAVDALGNAYVYGFTVSSDFPKRESLQAELNSGENSSNFVTKINTQTSGSDSLVYSTLLGLAAHGIPTDIALDAAGSVYLTGFTAPVIALGIIHTGRTSNPDRIPANSGNLSNPFVTKLSDSSPRALRFTSENYSVTEGDAKVEITLARTGDTSAPLSVDYATVEFPHLIPCDLAQRDRSGTYPGLAFARCDYTTAIGTLHFAAGEVSKTFSVYITDDAYVEPEESVNLFLMNQTPGTALSSPMSATLTIRDNDRSAGSNPIDDFRFFVRQHYLEFLNREPEQAGFDDWVRVLNNCPDVHHNPACDRATVSSAFFRSQEFQTKGSFVYRFYKVSLGRAPSYLEFVRDLNSVTGATAEEVVRKKAAFTDAWVQRAEFRLRYDGLRDPDAFVDKLLQTEGVALGGTGAVTRETLIEDLRAGRKTRAGVVRAIVEHPVVEAKEYNPAFVTMQYFGYLRRDPDLSGYQDWLRYLDAHPEDFRTMVKGFINSTEYRLRFGQP